MSKVAEDFVPKPEYTRVKFDANIRHRMDTIPNSLIYRAVDGKLPPTDEPQSCYVSVQNKGKTWHLFNAARFPLGRMAEHIAKLIRGKDKVVYDRQVASAEFGDVVVVVNAQDMHMTGRKKFYKMYRHHTKYAGGLKEISLPHLLVKDPAEIVRRAVAGMMPKNKHRQILMSKNLIIHAGPYHPHTAQGLPQFTEPVPTDIN